MNLKDSLIKAFDDFGEIYFDTTEGYLDGSLEMRTGGEDIVYSLEDNRYFKEWDYVAAPMWVQKSKKEITIDEIIVELEKYNVIPEEFIFGTMIERRKWEFR